MRSELSWAQPLMALVSHSKEMACTTKRAGLRIKLLAPVWNLVSSQAALSSCASSQLM